MLSPPRMRKQKKSKPKQKSLVASQSSFLLSCLCHLNFQYANSVRQDFTAQLRNLSVFLASSQFVWRYCHIYLPAAAMTNRPELSRLDDEIPDYPLEYYLERAKSEFCFIYDILLRVTSKNCSNPLRKTVIRIFSPTFLV